MRRPPELVTSIARETQMHLTRKRIKCTIYGVLSVAMTPGQEATTSAPSPRGSTTTTPGEASHPDLDR